MNKINTKEILKSLATVSGVSGNETAAAEVALGLLKPFAPNAYIDKFGTVNGFIGDKNNGKPTLMLEAHIDEIGMIVTYIEEGGFLRVGLCGGVDRRVLPAQTVTVFGKKPIKGIISTLPPHVAEDDKAVLKAEDIAIDTGYSKEELEKLVSLGDRVTVDSEFAELLNNRVSSKAIDDRCGVASILYALSVMDFSHVKYNLSVNFVVQEELGTRGAILAGYSVAPDFSISVDVSYALSPSCDPKKCGILGKGPMIGISPVLDRELSEKLIKLSKIHNIPYQTEIMSEDTGTDADEISNSRGGVRCMLISVPERYMHTPAEVVDLGDIEAVGSLIARFAEEGIDA